MRSQFWRGTAQINKNQPNVGFISKSGYVISDQNPLARLFFARQFRVRPEEHPAVCVKDS
jgi:hypothetical protein